MIFQEGVREIDQALLGYKERHGQCVSSQEKWRKHDTRYGKV